MSSKEIAIAIPEKYRDILIIAFSEDEIFTDSLKVAKKFNKRHKNILQFIEGIKAKPEYNRLRFQPITYFDDKGRSQPAYEMGEMEFAILAGKLSGPEAAEWQVTFFEAFKWAAKELHRTKMENALLEKELEVKERIEAMRQETHRYVSHRLENQKEVISEVVKPRDQKLARYVHRYTWMKQHMQTCTCDAGKLAKREWSRRLKGDAEDDNDDLLLFDSESVQPMYKDLDEKNGFLD